MYFERGANSYNLLKKNLILIVPGLVYIGIFLLLSLILLKISGLLNIVINNYADTEALTSEIKNLFTTSSILINFIIYLIIFIITNFIIGITALATKLDMIKSLMKNKKPNLGESFANSKNYFFAIFITKLLIYLIILIPILITVLIQLIFKQQVISIMLLVLTLLFYVYLIFVLYFVYPIIFLKTNSPIPAIKESFLFFINNKKHTIFTAIIATLTVLAVSYLLTPFQQLFLSIASGNVLLVLMIIFYIISTLINQAMDIWKNIFNFLNYLKK